MKNLLYAFLKRALDIGFGIIAMLLLSPMLLSLVLIIRKKLGTPVFYTQLRPGLKGRPFKLVKFRTMTDGRNADGTLLPDADRITRLGSILRSTSVDELPELINIMRGEMSLVGPRPLLIRYLPRYTAGQARRHEVKPGLTGWAQVNGRNALSWEEKFKLDVWYVDNWNLWLDLRIIHMTIVKVLRREGISQDGEATVSEFMGSQLPEKEEAPTC